MSGVTFSENSVISIITVLVNIVLNYGLLFGNLGMPNMGVAGSGLATGISMALSTLLFAVYVSVTPMYRHHRLLSSWDVASPGAQLSVEGCLAEVEDLYRPYKQKRRTREFLKGMELEDEEGNRISLIEKYDCSVANPAIRRCELMTRIRGFENICNELGYVGEFYTLTAPSKYHATTKAGYRNSKWNGASPSDTQSYLTGLWARIRAKLHREEIRIFGIRVAEPHHDGTPHWHMLMFMLPEDVERVRLIIRDYAWEEDHHELRSDKAKKARFHAEAIDPEKGSATGYVAKYISKNIDGYALDGEFDDESGELLKETAPAVSAWAARWPRCARSTCASAWAPPTSGSSPLARRASATVPLPQR